MKWTLDVDTNAFYCYVNEGVIERQRVGRVCIFDLDSNNLVVGVEILFPVDLSDVVFDLTNCGIGQVDSSRILGIIGQMNPYGVTFSPTSDQSTPTAPLPSDQTVSDLISA